MAKVTNNLDQGPSLNCCCNSVERLQHQLHQVQPLGLFWSPPIPPQCPAFSPGCPASSQLHPKWKSSSRLSPGIRRASSSIISSQLIISSTTFLLVLVLVKMWWYRIGWISHLGCQAKAFCSLIVEGHSCSFQHWTHHWPKEYLKFNDVIIRRSDTEYGIWDLTRKILTKGKILAFEVKLGLFWDHFWIFLGLLVVIFMKIKNTRKRQNNALSKQFPF